MIWIAGYVWMARCKDMQGIREVLYIYTSPRELSGLSPSLSPQEILPRLCAEDASPIRALTRV